MAGVQPAGCRGHPGSAGEHIIVLSWLDRARRDGLSTVPGDSLGSPLRGVFSTPSPNRPDPIGLHRVQILAIDGLRGPGRQAAAAGGSIVRDAAAAQWGGYFGYFSDPDGHLWKVASPSQ